MTTEEKRMMQPAQEYIRKLQHKRNAGTENCMLSSDLGRDMGITALDLHHYLIDVGFLFRERSTYELKLCKRYAGLGYAKTRSHFRYNSKGDLVETRFPVWTKKGQEFIKNLIQGCEQARAKSNSFELCRAEAGSIKDQGNRHKEKARNLKTTKAI